MFLWLYFHDTQESQHTPGDQLCWVLNNHHPQESLGNNPGPNPGQSDRLSRVQQTQCSLSCISDTKYAFAPFKSQPIVFPSPTHAAYPALLTRVGQQWMSRAKGAPDFPGHSFQHCYIWSKTLNTHRQVTRISLQSEQLLYACQWDLVL